MSEIRKTNESKYIWETSSFNIHYSIFDISKIMHNEYRIMNGEVS